MQQNLNLNNRPSCDLLRLWVYDTTNKDNGGYFIYPVLEGEGMIDEYGYPTPLSVGDFYWKWDQLVKQGKVADLSLSRWTRWEVPPNGENDGIDLYDGDIVKATWVEGLRETTITYVVEYFGIPEGRWVLNELGDHDNREYLPLTELGTGLRPLKSMQVVGHRWEEKRR